MATTALSATENPDRKMRPMRWSTNWVTVVLLSCAVAVYVARCLQFDFVADDAFISFRYARNVSNGLGFVFNPGERVEGYTNFLLVVLLAGLNRLGADIVTAGRLVSMLGGTAMVLTAAAVSRRLNPDVTWAPFATAFLVAINPFVAAWGSAGLETTLFGTLVLLTLLSAMTAEMTARRFVVASAVALLMSLTRPEGTAVYAFVIVALLFKAGDWRRRAAVFMPGFALYLIVSGGYVLWRWNYFGALMPNTYSAKSPFSATHLSLGAIYLIGFAANFSVLFSMPFAIRGLLNLRKTAPALSLVSVGLLAIILVEGGDGLPMYRFMVPLVPLLMAFAVARIAVLHPGGVRATRAPLVRGCLVMLLVAASLFPSHDAQYLLYQEQRDFEIPRWREAGVALARALPESAVVAAVPIGAVSWYSGLRVLDMLGLTDPVIAKAPIDVNIRWVGHQKHDGRYVLQRRPDALLLGNIFVSDSKEPPLVPLPSTNPVFLAREGDILNQPEFAREYRIAMLPLESGRYLHYYLRRDVVPRQKD